MTKNQIDYQKHREDVRTHQANEQISRGNLAETQRANMAREAENYRSNLARETETARANRAQEDLSYWKTGVESEDRRYASDQSLLGSKYSADRNYESRTDSAYINKYGISPSTVKQGFDIVKDAGTKFGKTLVTLSTSKPGQAIAKGMSDTAKAIAGGKDIKGQVTGLATSLGELHKPNKTNNSRRH